MEPEPTSEYGRGGNMESLADLLDAIRESPDFEVGERSIRVRTPLDSPQEPAEEGGGEGLLGFEVTVTSNAITAEHGVIGRTAIAKQTKSSPTNGTWYLEAKVVIDQTTGAVDEPAGVSVTWVSAETADTATDYHHTIARVDVVSGTPDPATIVQANYGPILFQPAGGVGDKWIVAFF